MTKAIQTRSVPDRVHFAQNIATMETTTLSIDNYLLRRAVQFEIMVCKKNWIWLNDLCRMKIDVDFISTYLNQICVVG